jgi:hypothetical protein
MQSTRTDDWSKGANNVSRPDRLPANFVRQLVNLDPSPGGRLQMRAQFSQVAPAADMRLAVGATGKVVYVDGGTVGCYLLATDATQQIGSIAATGPIAGVEHNGQVYISTQTDSIRVDGETVKAWAIHAPQFSVEVIAGSLPAGIYKFAVTATGDDGEESGADPLIVRLDGTQAVRLTSTDARPLRTYATVNDGATLFSQGPLIGGSMAITLVDDSRERLTTSGLVGMPHCSMMVSYRSIIVGVSGDYLVFSVPMLPHLMDSVAGFVRYAKSPALIAATDGGIYVVADDKTYFVTDLDSDKPSSRMVLDLGATSGTAVTLPDGRAAWFTRYGQAIGDQAGNITLPNRDTYAPDLAANGASGLLEHNGCSMVVTTMRGPASPNNIATGDFADLETE